MLRGIAVSAVGAVAVAAAGGRPADAEAAVPTAVTGEASPVSLQTATLHATIDSNGQPTTFYFQYGTSANYGFTTAGQDAGAGVTQETVSATVSNLVFGTGYHYRVVAANASGQASGEDLTFRTRDAILSGRYSVALTVVRGGFAFGQHSGLVVHRRYRFTARCRQGSCGTVSLRRRGAKGTFASKLTRHEGDRYAGIERSRGHCDNGERFKATAAVLVHPTSLSGGRAVRIAGRLHIRVRGCLHAAEVARLTGRLESLGHG